MPRKENLSLEERIERARQLAESKQKENSKNIAALYQTRIYRLARYSSIFFLWLSQLILIDWSLPYTPSKDKITEGYRIQYGSSSARGSKEMQVNIRTQQSVKLQLVMDYESTIPHLNDSICLYKSFLLHETKKIKDLNSGESFSVSSSLTYLFLPLIIICSAYTIFYI